MITDAMPPANSSGQLFNVLTFFAGFLFSIVEAPASVLAKITLFGSLEVIWYGALGGLASLIVKQFGEYAFANYKTLWVYCSTWFKRKI